MSRTFISHEDDTQDPPEDYLDYDCRDCDCPADGDAEAYWPPCPVHGPFESTNTTQQEDTTA